MDAELYTFWDMVVFYLLYYRVFLFGVLFLLDIHLFTRWKRGRAARVGAVLLAVCLAAAVLWWYAPVLF